MMMIGDKRKAEVLGEKNIHGKRAAIFPNVYDSAHDSALSTSQEAHESPRVNGNCWAQQQTITPPTSPLEDGVTSDLDMEMTDSNSPSIEHVQRSINDFYNHHVHLFGQAHQSDIRKAHQEVMSSCVSETVLAAGEAFVAALHDYVQDLQQAAVRQIQWRASMRNIGASKEVLSATDTVLSELDVQIIGIGADAENLMQETLTLRGHSQA